MFYPWSLIPFHLLEVYRKRGIISINHKPWLLWPIPLPNKRNPAVTETPQN